MELILVADLIRGKFKGIRRVTSIGDLTYCRSYSPLLVFLSTVNPAFLASLMETGLVMVGVLNPEINFFTDFLQSGQLVSGFADKGRRNVKLPPQTLQSPPSSNSYS